jgi:starvation-inducible DNA-binding protein
MPRSFRRPKSPVIEHPGRKNQGTFETRIDISPENREQIIQLLNARLADTLDLYTQTKFAHWNVKGNDFYQLHLLFDSIAEHVLTAVDTIAERVTALGGRAEGTLRQAAATSSLDEYDTDLTRGMDHVRTLADRLAAVGNAARVAIDKADELEDQGTSDLFTQLVREMDKDLYFLESHIQIPSSK